MMLGGIAVILVAQLAVTEAASSESVSASSHKQPDSSYVSLDATDDGRRTRVDVHGRNFLMRASPDDPQGDSHEGGAFWVERHDGFYHLKNIGIIVSDPTPSEWKFGDLSCRRRDVNEDTHANSCKRDGTGEQITSIVSRSRGVLSFTGHCWLTARRSCTYVLISERGIPHP